MTKKELTKKESTEVAVAGAEFDPSLCGFGEESGIDFSDVTIGRINIQQALSQFVAQGATQIGDIINLLDKEVLGGKEKEFEFIPLSAFYYWKETNDEKFVKRVLGKIPNGMPVEDGKIKRMQYHSFYILIPSEIAEGSALPIELPFKSSARSSGAGVLSNYITKLWKKKQNTWMHTFKMKTVLTTNKQNQSYYVPELSWGRPSNEQEIAEAAQWARILKDSASTIKHTEDEEDNRSPAQAPQNVQGPQNYDMGKF